jgi:RNA polymerase sigma-70 factor (ECF subfamily)
MINGLPGVIVDAPEGPVQTAAFEIADGVVRALYVVRNPDKLRHLARHTPAASDEMTDQ